MRNFINYCLLVVAVLPMTGMNFPVTDEYLIFINLFAFFAFIWTKQKFDIFIFIIIVLFTSINLFSSLVFGAFDFYTFVGFILRLTAPYLIIKVVGKEMLRIFPKFAMVIALFSIPFYIIQLIDYNILLNYFSYYRLISIDIRLLAGKFNLFFHTLDITDLNRNCGFLSEPGALGYFLGMAIMLDLFRTNFKLDLRIIILICVGLTTLSTTFYIFILITIIFINVYSSLVRKWIVITFPIFVFISYLILTQSFMIEKMDYNYSYSNEINTTHLNSDQDKLGRLGNFKVEMTEFINYPLGWGINMNGRIKTSAGDYASGPCGLSHHLTRWGIVGLILLILALVKFNLYMNKTYSRKIGYYSSITILLFLFSNPIDRDAFLLAILYLPFISNKGLKQAHSIIS